MATTASNPCEHCGHGSWSHMPAGSACLQCPLDGPECLGSWPLSPTLERISHSYAEACLDGQAYDGWDTLTTLRHYNRDGLGYQEPSGAADSHSYVQVTGVYLSDADLEDVATRIDRLIATGAY